MRILLIISIFLFGSEFITAQNLLGYSSDKVKEYFSENEPSMVLDKNFKNDKYNYLKYTDIQDDMKTVLVFMSDKNRCSSLKAMYDMSLEEEVLVALNKNHTKAGHMLWIDNGKKKAEITFSKDEWFITVLYKQK